jgi:hypothetical protein
MCTTSIPIFSRAPVASIEDLAQLVTAKLSLTAVAFAQLPELPLLNRTVLPRTTVQQRQTTRELMPPDREHAQEAIGALPSWQVAIQWMRITNDLI